MPWHLAQLVKSRFNKKLRSVKLVFSREATLRTIGTREERPPTAALPFVRGSPLNSALPLLDIAGLSQRFDSPLD